MNWCLSCIYNGDRKSRQCYTCTEGHEDLTAPSQYVPKKDIHTHSDRLRQSTDEEIAKMIANKHLWNCPSDVPEHGGCKDQHCDDCWLRYLKSPIEEVNLMEYFKLGWLSPTGEFHECHSYDHIDVARELADALRLHCYDFKTERRISEDEALLKAGWAYIGVSLLGIKEYNIYWERHLTSEQRQFLQPYFDLSNDILVGRVSRDHWNFEIEDN